MDGPSTYVRDLTLCILQYSEYTYPLNIQNKLLGFHAQYIKKSYNYNNQLFA